MTACCQLTAEGHCRSFKWHDCTTANKLHLTKAQCVVILTMYWLVYRQHAARYEAEFLEDMGALGCRRPDVMTRVSEYMTEIVDYIKTIMSNNMAYESNGSVHFDTQAFRYMRVCNGPIMLRLLLTAAQKAAEGRSSPILCSCNCALMHASLCQQSSTVLVDDLVCIAASFTQSSAISCNSAEQKCAAGTLVMCMAS